MKVGRVLHVGATPAPLLSQLCCCGKTASVVQVGDRVVGLFLGELFAVLADELVSNCLIGHVERFFVFFGLSEGVCIPVGLDIVDCVLGCLGGRILQSRW